MKAVIFVGPSLPEAEVKRILPDALILPPAEQGDVDFARYQLGADIIGLIDGKHTQVLPPLHKEILSVIEDGCRFVGAASMGALRAVECEEYGAEPVGEVAEWYKSGTIDADDEVCLVHADRDSGYKKLSVPLVNIRATMRAADIEDSLKQEIIDYAKCLFYPDRDWQTIFDACDIDNRAEMIIQGSYCDVKEADSLHLCYYIANGLKSRSPVRKRAQHTHYGFAAVFENNDRKMLYGNKVIRKHQIAERGSKYDMMNTRNRALALELCKVLGLHEGVTDTEVFVSLHDLTPKENQELLKEELMLNRAGEWIVSRSSGADIVRSINDFLRISGRYESIKENI